MKKIVDIINNLTNLLPLKPASDNEITDAELQLGLSFAEEYKDYLAEFGAIMADGIELSGIAKAEHRNVVILTKKEWNLNPKVPNTMYVIENTYVDGIIIWQNMKGIIYQTQPNTEPRKIADSMAEYISNRK
jgi:hypothetical protein